VSFVSWSKGQSCYDCTWKSSISISSIFHFCGSRSLLARFKLDAVTQLELKITFQDFNRRHSYSWIVKLCLYFIFGGMGGKKKNNNWSLSCETRVVTNVIKNLLWLNTRYLLKHSWHRQVSLEKYTKTGNSAKMSPNVAESQKNCLTTFYFCLKKIGIRVALPSRFYERFSSTHTH